MLHHSTIKRSMPPGRLRPAATSREVLFKRKTPRWKRSLDMIGALIGLLLTLPLTLMISIYIKAVSPGPLFFKQSRVGLGGEPFGCLKFRTMKPNADPGSHRLYLTQLIGSARQNKGSGMRMKKMRHDPRIIRGGNLLRESGLDELPQLINVLRGEMSLVGPRPPIPYEVAQYELWHMKRFDTLPGLTGLWQVSGKNRLTFTEMMRLDIQYAEKCSFLLDIKILFMTPMAILVQLKDYLVQHKSPPTASPRPVVHPDPGNKKSFL